MEAQIENTKPLLLNENLNFKIFRVQEVILHIRGKNQQVPFGKTTQGFP